MSKTTKNKQFFQRMIYVMVYIIFIIYKYQIAAINCNNNILAFLWMIILNDCDIIKI